MKITRFIKGGNNPFLNYVLVFLLSIFFVSTQELSAQDGGIQVSGVVSDQTGEPLIGAAVRVKGTTVGKLTDIDGKFALKVPSKSSVLMFTYSGMKSQEITLGNQTVLKVVLQEDSKVLEAVVITAMGIERKSKSLTYATQKINNDELMRVQDANFVNSLQGKAAGMSITPNAGGAGGASKILLRGSKSILGSNAPLIVIDGIPMSNSVSDQKGVDGGSGLGYGFSTEGSDALSSVNPDDIQSVNILKGANAAALYGSKAANGVLMITTKKGKEGKLNITLTSNATFERPLILPEFQNTYGSIINKTTKKVSANSWGDKMSKLSGKDLIVGQAHLRSAGENDAANFFNTGSTFNNSISINGGSKNVLSYFSYGNTTANGMIENNNFQRHTFAFRQNYKVFGDKLKIDLSINHVNQSTKNRPGGGTSLNPIYHLYTTPRGADMAYYKENYKIEDGKWMSNPTEHLVSLGDGKYEKRTEQIELTGPKQNWLYDAPDQNNPYWLVNMMNRKEVQDRTYGYVAANYNIFKGLSLQGRFSLDRSKTESKDERAATTQFPSAMIDKGIYGQRIAKSNEFYMDAMLNYNTNIEDFSLALNGGALAHRIVGESQGMFENATNYDYSLLQLSKYVNLYDPRAGSGGSRSYNKTSDWDQSLFLTGQVGWKDAVFVEGSYRRDWYRAFAQFRDRVPDNYGYFSFGANALIHSLVELPTVISNLKVRTSYSEVGNSIPNLLYNAVGINFTTGAVTPSQYSYFNNPIPEISKSFEAGFDVSFFKNALSWELTYYNASMNNNYLLVGFGGLSKPVNSGVIRNMGLETTISYAVELTKDLTWRTGFNFAYNDNVIEKTYTENGKEALISQEIGFGGKFQIRYKEGGKYGDLYATDFRRDENGKIKLSNEGKPMLSSEKYGKFIGNMNSPYQLGFHNRFSYKGISLYFLIDGRIGGKTVSFTEAYLDKLGLSKRTGDARLLAEQDPTLRYEDVEGDIYPALRLEDGQLAPIQKYYEGIGGDINATQYVYDATNFRLREVSFGYTFQNLLGKNKNLSLSVIGRNLFFLYNNTPVDPDTSISTQNSLGNFDIFNMPSARSVGVSATIAF